MEKRSVMVFILSFIVLAGAGIVYLFIPKGVNAPFLTPDPQPVPNPTPTGWKTYENKEFGFAFDYPGDWVMTENKEILKTYAPLDLFFYNNISGGVEALVLARKFDPDDIIFNTGSLEGTIKIKKDNPYLKVIDLNSQKGYRFPGTAGDCTGDFIQTPIKNYTLQIGFTQCIDDNIVAENIKDSIIQSFKFTK